MAESGGSVALICKTNDSERIKNDSLLSRKCHEKLGGKEAKKEEKNGEETLKRAELWAL